MAKETLLIEVNERGARVVSRNIEDIGKKSSLTHGLVSQLRTTLLTLGAGFSLAAAISTMATFSQEMSTVQAVSQATNEEFRQLRETAQSLGATTRFSATEAAQGMVFLAKAGFQANEVMETIGHSLQLAQAGSLDLASASDITVNTLKGFRLGVEEAQRVVDVLVKADNLATTSVFELGDGMKYVASIAAGLNVSLEETSAAMAVMSNAGLAGTMAGTGLRRILSELESPSTKTAGILQSLGLTIDEVRVSSVGLTTAMQRLKGAGIDTGLALEVFGDRGGPAFETLSAGLEDMVRFTAAMEDAKGTASEIARIMDDNLNGALLATKSAFEALVLAIGDLGAESIVTGFFKNTATSVRFLAANLQDAADAVQVLGVAFVVAMRTQIIASLKAATLAMAAFTAALLANPFTALAVAITSVTSLLVFFQDELTLTADKSTTMRDLFNATMGTMRESINATSEFFSEKFGFIGDYAEAIFGDIEFSIEGMLRFTARITDGFIGLWVGAFKAFAQLTDQALIQAFKDIAIRGINAVRKIVEDGLNIIIEKIRLIPGLGGIGNVVIGQMENDVAGAAGRIGTNIKNAFVEGFTGIDFATGVVDELIYKADLLAAKRRELQPITVTAQKRPELPGVGTGTAGAGKLDPTLKLIIQDLEIQKELLGLTNRERATQNELVQIEDALKRSLTTTERALVEPMIRELQALEDQANLLDELRGPQEAFIHGKAALVALYDKGAISLKEYTNKLRELEIASLETDESLQGGIRLGLMKFADEMMNVGNQVENLVINAFNKAEEAIIKFVDTGKLEIKSLVASMLTDFAKMQLRKNVLGPLANAAAGFFGGGRDVFGMGNAFLGSIPSKRSFDSGIGYVPHDMFAKLHKGESVMTAGQSRGAGSVTVNVINETGQPMTATSQSRQGPGGSQVIDVMVKGSLDRLDSSGQLDGMFKRHGADRRGNR